MENVQRLDMYQAHRVLIDTCATQTVECLTKVCISEIDAKSSASIKGCFQAFQVEGKIEDVPIILGCS